MSTIDSSRVYDKPCPCGAGWIIITKCSPDHPYVRDSQTWYEGKLDCSVCGEEYKIDEVDENDSRFIILRPYDYKSNILLIKIERFCRGLSE